jgi:hypothetical protein
MSRTHVARLLALLALLGAAPGLALPDAEERRRREDPEPQLRPASLLPLVAAGVAVLATLCLVVARLAARRQPSQAAAHA